MRAPPFRNAVASADAAAYRAAGWWGDVTLVDHLRHHAAERPDDPAYLADDGILTWAELDRASTRVARTLCDLGLEPGTRVAVFMPDTASVHATFLGVEMAGLVTVGIGARATTREIAHLLASTGARTLLSLDTHRGRPAATVRAELAEIGVALDHHVEVPLFEAAPDGDFRVDGTPTEPPADPDPRHDLDARRIGPDDLSFINSTSGTTGLPKCVLHTQNRWLYFHQKAAEHGRFGPDEVVMSVVPAPFGFGLWTAHFTPIVLGAPTVVTRSFDAADALRLIEQHRVTVLACVSTQFLMMLNHADFDRRDLGSLRAMFTGGEAVPEARAREFETRSGATVLQFYGSNETGVLSGTRIGEPLVERITTAGRVVPEMQVRLYDADGQHQLPIPGEGRPACKGPATCIGYLDTDANGGLFTDDGWMLMGDLVSIDADGLLTVTGRISDFIIRGGKNISAAQVEDEVNTHPAVGLSAAVAIPDDVFGERVCVYVELASRRCRAHPRRPRRPPRGPRHPRAGPPRGPRGARRPSAVERRQDRQGRDCRRRRPPLRPVRPRRDVTRRRPTATTNPRRAGHRVGRRSAAPAGPRTR
ncbi:MAG: class I adenylate-forming enzyme family protein [Acidimicrobiales bacterium]